MPRPEDTLWLDTRLCGRVIDAANAIERARTRLLDPHGLTPSGFRMMLALHHAKDRAAEPGVLADKILHVSRPSVTGVADTLERLGYLRRVASTVDRRRIFLELTDAGAAKVEELIETWRELHDKLAVGFDDTEKGAFAHYLNRLIEAAQ